NNDGAMDIVVTGLNERPRILINSGTPGNHWLLLNMEGRKSNRDAIGARIKVTTASGRVLYNHVSVATGFMSSSDKRVHLGLGHDDAVKSLEVRWPSGIVQKLTNVGVDRIVHIVEPAK
ncbi:MAG: ASPIC/UnbV domain-containing protein, partial [Bryobacteraceae bacterium]